MTTFHEEVKKILDMFSLLSGGTKMASEGEDWIKAAKKAYKPEDLTWFAYTWREVVGPDGTYYYRNLETGVERDEKPERFDVSIREGKYNRSLIVGNMNGLDNLMELAQTKLVLPQLHRFERLAESIDEPLVVPPHRPKRVPAPVAKDVCDFDMDANRAWRRGRQNQLNQGVGPPMLQLQTIIESSQKPGPAAAPRAPVEKPAPVEAVPTVRAPRAPLPPSRGGKGPRPPPPSLTTIWRAMARKLYHRFKKEKRSGVVLDAPFLKRIRAEIESRLNGSGSHIPVSTTDEIKKELEFIGF